MKNHFIDLDTSKFWLTYKHGLPFSEKIGENIETQINRVKKKLASLMIFDGGVGQGKTTLNVLAGDFVNLKNGLDPIDLSDKKNPQIALGGVDFIKKMRKCYDQKLPYIVYTEAGDFSKRGALTKFNKLLNDTFETYRAFKIIVGLDLPSMNSLDPHIFDNQIPRILLNCHNRGDTYGNIKGYGLYRMYWLKQTMTKIVVKPMAYSRVEPNFVGHFLNLPKEREKQLDTLTTTNKLLKLKKSEVEVEGLLNYNQISIRLMRSIRWVRFAVNTLKIKPTRTINRTKYFKEEVLSILGEHLEKLEDQQYKNYKRYKKNSEIREELEDEQNNTER